VIEAEAVDEIKSIKILFCQNEKMRRRGLTALTNDGECLISDET
jgi:hypothetical protein